MRTPVAPGWLTEGRKFNQVRRGDRFGGQASLTPGAKTTRDHIRIESVFFEEQRHTGASSFAQSSAVEIDVLILGQHLDFFREVVGLKSNGASDALRGSVVVTVAADIGDNDIVGFGL